MPWSSKTMLNLLIGNISGNTMSEWKECTIGELCKNICSGGTPNRSNADFFRNGNIPWLNTKEVSFNRIYQTENFITEAGLKSSAAKWIPENTVVVAMYGATAGRSAIAKIPLTTNQACCNLVVDEDKADYRFVYYWLLGNYEHLASLANGGAQQNLNAGLIRDYKVRAPDLELQRKIADILSSLDDKIELNNQINRNLEEQAQAIFNSAYDDAKKVVPFTSLISIGSGGTPQTSEPSFWNGTIPFFTPKDVGTPYTLVTEKNITDEGLNNCNSKLYPENTTFITARGTVGKLSLAAVPMAMNQSCFALINKEMNPFMIYLYAVRAIKGLKKKSNGAVFDAITIKDFETEFVNEISNDKIRSLIEAIEPMFNQIRLNIIENNRLADLRDSLLPKLMTSEIDIAKVKL